MHRNFLICVLLAGLSLATFWPVGQLGFFSIDDEGPKSYVIGNKIVQAGITLEGVSWAFTTTHAGNWHPITWLSHMLDCQLFGTNPSGHHWVNLGFHIINTLLLFWVLRTMTGATWRSALVAALFAIHPLHVESVVWISERKDVLSSFFFFLTLLAYTKYVQKSIAGGILPTIGIVKTDQTAFPMSASYHSSCCYCLSVIFFAFGLMSKPMLVTLPFILLFLDFWPLNRIGNLQLMVFKPLLIEKTPFFVMSALSCIVTFNAQNESGSVAKLDSLPLESRIGNSLVSVVSYLGKILWPENLAIFYPFQQIPFWEELYCGVLLAVLTLLCLWRNRLQPYLLMGWLWFLIMLIPVIGLVQVGKQSMADRYTYLPSIGLFLAMVWASADVVMKKNLPAVSAVFPTGLLVTCLLASRIQLNYWRNETELFRHAIEVTGNNFTSNFGLAGALLKAGRFNEAGRNFRYITRVSPDNLQGHFYLGLILLKNKKYDEAWTQFDDVMRLDGYNPEVILVIRKYRGDILSTKQKFADAEVEYSIAAQLRPDDLVIQQSRLKNHLLEILYNEPNTIEALNNLAWLLATSPDPDLRDGSRAVELAKQACELSHYRETVMVGTLAAAYAEAGQFDKAVKTAQKAMHLAKLNGQPKLQETNRQLLEFYQQGKAYHESLKPEP